MTSSVSILRLFGKANAAPVPISALRIAAWSFSLMGLMFFAPEEGFRYIVWESTQSIASILADVVLGVVVTSLISLLPAVMLFEVWATKREGRTVRQRGLAVWVLVAVVGILVQGLGLPIFYVALLLPSGATTLFPMFMAFSGFGVWYLLFKMRNRLVKPSA